MQFLNTVQGQRDGPDDGATRTHIMGRVCKSLHAQHEVDTLMASIRCGESENYKEFIGTWRSEYCNKYIYRLAFDFDIASNTQKLDLAGVHKRALDIASYLCMTYSNYVKNCQDDITFEIYYTSRKSKDKNTGEDVWWHVHFINFVFIYSMRGDSHLLENVRRDAILGITGHLNGWADADCGAGSTLWMLYGSYKFGKHYNTLNIDKHDSYYRTVAKAIIKCQSNGDILSGGVF